MTDPDRLVPGTLWTAVRPASTAGPTTRTAESAVAGTDAVLAQSQALRDLLR